MFVVGLVGEEGRPGGVILGLAMALVGRESGVYGPYDPGTYS